MPIHRLYVCTTCLRDGPVAPGGDTRGALLANAVEAALVRQPVAGEFDFIRVPCLNGCLNPCNVALRAARKYNLRVSRLEPGQAQDVVTLLRAYLDDPLGDPPESAWPAALQGKRSVHTPPPHLLLRRG